MLRSGSHPFFGGLNLSEEKNFLPGHRPGQPGVGQEAFDGWCLWLRHRLDDRIDWPQLIRQFGLSQADIKSVFLYYSKLTTMTWIRQQRDQGLGAAPLVGDNVLQNASPVPVRRRRKLVVVDDNAVHQQLFRAALGASFALVEAHNSDLALERIRLDPPDGVLLDAVLPGQCNGYELCQLIKKDRDLQQVHIVMVTARTQVKDREKAFSAGVDAYFPKPFSPGELLAYLIEKMPN